MKIEFNRKMKFLTAAVAVIFSITIILLVTDMKERSAYSRTEGQLQEMIALAKKYQDARDITGLIEKRINLSKPESLPVLVDEMISALGLKGKLQSVKPFGGGSRENYDIQEAEVILDKLTLNELVNILHSIYTTPSGLFVTSAEFKRDFTERNLINARMSLKLVVLKEGKKK